jgi:hypothetical protein
MHEKFLDSTIIDADGIIDRVLFIFNSGFYFNELQHLHQVVLAATPKLGIKPSPALQELLLHNTFSHDLILQLAQNLEIAAWVVQYHQSIPDLAIVGLCKMHQNYPSIIKALAQRTELSVLLQDYVLSIGDVEIIQCMIMEFASRHAFLADSILLELLHCYSQHPEIIRLLLQMYQDDGHYKLKTLIPLLKNTPSQIVIIEQLISLYSNDIIYFEVAKSNSSFDFAITEQLQQQLSAVIEFALLAQSSLDEKYILGLLSNGDIYSFIYAIARNTESSFGAVKEIICQDFGSNYSRDLLKKAGISTSGLVIVKQVITTLYKHTVTHYLDHNRLQRILRKDLHGISFS